MHVINDIEAFYEEIKETVYHWFGTGINGENGKEAINLVILNHASPIITGTLTPVKEEKTKKAKKEELEIIPQILPNSTEIETPETEV